MKHLSKGFALLAISATMLSSCVEDNPWNGIGSDKGKLSVTLTADGNVLRSTRSDDTKATIIPSPEEFGITMSRTDGSSTQKWANITAFNKEESFPIGEYLIEASYGDLNREGFENPYFTGSQVVSVTSGDEKNVSIKASLANCMVSVRYTDDFNSIYPEHSAAVKSTGNNYVVFTGDEDRPAYMCPSQMTLNLTMTSSSGKQVTIQPAGFTAQPRRHYVITIGVNGTQDRGNLTLDVQFEENVVAETVNVSLGDELFEADPPTIGTRDFTPGESLKSFESLSVNEDPRFEIYAFGGVKEVNMTVTSSNYRSPFGSEVQLVNASPLSQSNVAAAGIEVYGLYKNPDKMGIVKLKGLLEKLPVGTHKVTLQVVDAMTRVSEPVAFDAEVSAVSVRIYSAKNTVFMTPDAEIFVSTNCPDIRNKCSFKVSSDNYDAEIVNVETLSQAPYADVPADLNYHYKYTLKSARNLKRDNSPVKLFYGSKDEPRAIAEMKMDFPKFKIEIDPMATLTKFRIVPDDPSMLDIICDNLILFNHGKQVDVDDFVAMDGFEGVMELLDLTPATTYPDVKCYLSYPSNPMIEIPAFTTEADLQVPNRYFSDIAQTLNFSNIQVGGQYGVTYLGDTYTLKSSIEISEAVGWASLNQLTCYANSSNRNTWFMVPSTYAENGTSVIRTVGYNHNGTTPSTSRGAASTKYYCTNSPSSSQLIVSRGEMFLGSYSFDGTPHRVDGINFASRPLSVSFEYKYTPTGNEEGEIVAQVYDAQGTLLNENSMELSGTAAMVTKKMNIFGYPFGKKPAKLVLCFRSTRSDVTPQIKIPTGDELNEHQSLGNHTLSANSYHALATGSELVVAKVELGYELASGSSRSRVKSKK